MSITFNNIPTDLRVPGSYTEIDNSRALSGLVQNPHRALIIGQKIAAGSVSTDTLAAITKENMADSFFGAGSGLARTINAFKENNPYTELWGLAISNAATGVSASGQITFSAGISISGTHTLYLMINGVAVNVAFTSGMSGCDFTSTIIDTVNGSTYSHLPVVASAQSAASALNNDQSNITIFNAVDPGENGNYIDIRVNYYEGQSTPWPFATVGVSTMVGGANNPDLGDAWTVIAGERYHYIVNPFNDSANLTEIEDELSDRFGPMEDLQGHGFTGFRGTQASCTSLGNGRNSPHNTIIGAYDAPNDPIEWAAALGGVAAFYLHNDPARPLQYLKLKGILPPPIVNRFIPTERQILLYDGIATWIVDSGGNVLIERCITTYQSNALGLPDPSYLDVQTLATLGEIRDQYQIRMVNRFIVPRFKLADDTFPVQPGSKVATPKILKSEIAALFTLLRDKGLIENLDEFIENILVERDSADVNRVNVLLSPDLINQFRILATQIQFIL